MQMYLPVWHVKIKKTQLKSYCEWQEIEQVEMFNFLGGWEGHLFWFFFLLLFFLFYSFNLAVPFFPLMLNFYCYKSL